MLTAEQRERKNAAQHAKWAAITAEQRERKNAAQRAKWAAMTEEQRLAMNARRRMRRRPAHAPFRPVLSRHDLGKAMQDRQGGWLTMGNRSFDLRWYWWLRGDADDELTRTSREKMIAHGCGKDLPARNDPHYLAHFNRLLLRRALAAQQQQSGMVVPDRLQHYIDRLTETLPLLEESANNQQRKQIHEQSEEEEHPT